MPTPHGKAVLSSAALRDHGYDMCRANRRDRSDASKAEKLPVFSSRSATRASRRTASLASSAGSATATPVPDSTGNSHSTASLSAMRTHRRDHWGKAKSEQAVEHTWNGIATSDRVASLKPKEELELTTRLKKYLKLQERYDTLSATLGYSPTMNEFATHLGTNQIGKVEAIMSAGPKQKAAMVRHNMGLVINIINKYEHEEVTREVRNTSQSDEHLVHSPALPLLSCNILQSHLLLHVHLEG